MVDGVEGLLGRGPGRPVLPDPVERRMLRELWGVPLAEVADALGVEPEEMWGWEEGACELDDEDTRAYYRLLHGFRHQMPEAYEPDWAALRPPSAGRLAVDACDHREGACPRCSTLTSRPAPIPEPAGPEPAAPESVAPRPAACAARPPSHGAPWSEEDQERLAERFHEKAEIALLAGEFGRSEKAIRFKLHDLGLKPSSGTHHPPTRPATPPASRPGAPGGAEASSVPSAPLPDTVPLGRPLRLVWWHTKSSGKRTRHVTLEGHWTVCKRKVPAQAQVGSEDTKWYLKATCYNCAHRLDAHYRHLGYLTPVDGHDFPPRRHPPAGNEAPPGSTGTSPHARPGPHAGDSSSPRPEEEMPAPPGNEDPAAPPSAGESDGGGKTYWTPLLQECGCVIDWGWQTETADPYSFMAWCLRCVKAPCPWHEAADQKLPDAIAVQPAGSEAVLHARKAAPDSLELGRELAGRVAQLMNKSIEAPETLLQDAPPAFRDWLTRNETDPVNAWLDHCLTELLLNRGRSIQTPQLLADLSAAPGPEPSSPDPSSPGPKTGCAACAVSAALGGILCVCGHDWSCHTDGLHEPCSHCACAGMRTPEEQEPDR